MLGLETLPAILYFYGLYFVPRSPRWLLMKNRKEEAVAILEGFNTKAQVDSDLVEIENSIHADKNKPKVRVGGVNFLICR